MSLCCVQLNRSISQYPNLSSSSDQLVDISLISRKFINEQYNILYATNQCINHNEKTITFKLTENDTDDCVDFSSISSVCQIHHSLCWGKRHCYRIVITNGSAEKKSLVFFCANQTERDYHIQEIRSIIYNSKNSVNFEENMLSIGIQELRNLTQKTKYYCEIFLDDLIYARTAVKEMKEFLFWGEEFELTSSLKITMVSIILWRLPRLKERYKVPHLVCHVNIPIDSISRHCFTEKWYFPSVCILKLTPKITHNLSFSATCDIMDFPPNHQRMQSQIMESSPVFRVKSKYFSLKIMDCGCYAEFIEFIKMNGLNILREMESEIKAKYRELLILPIIQLSTMENWVEEFLSELIAKEAQSSDINLILRGNSMASKAVECFLKLECHLYLQNILQTTVRDIVINERDFEIDYSQLMKRNEPISSWAIKKRVKKLENVVDYVLKTIFNSIDIVPRRVQTVFSRLRSKLKNFGIMNLEFTQKVISACFFLRLVCPAIMTPYLFQLLPHYSENYLVNRSLTLVAKCVQNIANFSGVDDSKENYMHSVSLHCQIYYDQMSAFINAISSLNSTNDVVSDMQSPDHKSKLAIYSARVCYYMEFCMSELCTKKYTGLQELKEVINRIKEMQDFITEDNVIINKINKSCEFIEMGITAASTINSSGYFSISEHHFGTINSDMNILDSSLSLCNKYQNLPLSTNFSSESQPSCSILNDPINGSKSQDSKLIVS